RSADRTDNLAGKAGKRSEEVRALFLESPHLVAVLVSSTRAFVELSRLEDLVVVDAPDDGGDLITEVGVAHPLDRGFCNALDDRRRVLDPYLLRALVLLRPAYPTRVDKVDLERMLFEQFEEAVPLEVVQHREE